MNRTFILAAKYNNSNHVQIRSSNQPSIFILFSPKRKIKTVNIKTLIVRIVSVTLIHCESVNSPCFLITVRRQQLWFDVNKAKGKYRRQR